MPGHVKKSSGPDEDPCPYLVVTLDMKREHAMKPYDPKKSYWCPAGKGDYMECILENDDGTKAVVMCGHEVINSKSQAKVLFTVVISSRLTENIVCTHLKQNKFRFHIYIKPY